MLKKIKNLLADLEWMGSLAAMLWASAAISFTALPAWGVRSLNLFSELAPLSWIIAGMGGFLVFCIGYFFASLARRWAIRSKYDDRAMSKGSFVNPTERVFEKQRIFLNDFALPSNPFIQGKTFIDCEIIGPSNILLAAGNNIKEPMLPDCDAAVLPPETQIHNSYSFVGCTFQRCSFQRITFFVSAQEYQGAKHLDWLRWVTYRPDSDMQLFSRSDPPALEDGRTKDAKSETSPEGQD